MDPKDEPKLQISPQAHKNILEAVKLSPIVFSKNSRRMAISSEPGDPGEYLKKSTTKSN